MSASEGSAAEQFRGKVIWITGASSGIGEALCREFARGGARLVLSARNQSELERVRDDCVAAGSRAEDLLVLPLDVVDFAAMPGAVKQVEQAFSGIDMLINNAGMSQRSFCVDTELDVYRTLLEVNVLGQIALTKAVLPVMMAQGSGHIAVTASVAGKVGAPMRTGYCAAKHAVMGFFDSLRTEVAYLGIQVSTIVPGFIRTNIAKSALTATGEATDMEEADIEGGMDANDCARVVIQGLADGVKEIAVGEGPEMALLDLKRNDPEQTFSLLEGAAAEARAGRGFSQ
jgi:NADP-dependent 3-hydroxy acid dehydrogenase YdfG